MRRLVTELQITLAAMRAARLEKAWRRHQDAHQGPPAGLYSLCETCHGLERSLAAAIDRVIALQSTL